MLRHPLVRMLALALILPSAARAQTFKQAPLPQVGTAPTSTSQFRGPTPFIGTGAYAVWIGEPQDNQSFSLGTASSLAWQNSSGVAVQPTSGLSGTVRVTFAPNNTMLRNAIQQSCYGQQTCAGPGWTVVVFTRNLPGGLVMHYTAQAATLGPVSAGVNGGGTAVIAFQRLFVQTTSSAQPPASQQGRVN